MKDIRYFHNKYSMSKGKLDLTKEYKLYYTAKMEPEIVYVDERKFLTIEGRGAQVVMSFRLRSVHYILLPIVSKEL